MNKIENEKNVEKFILDLYKKSNTKSLLKKEDKQKLNTIMEVVNIIIQDICKNEHVNKIEYLSTGKYSTVLCVGDKVVKIGKDRATLKFPNNPYINAPLLRKEFKINEDLSFFIEVNEKVDTKTDISTEELYDLYKKLRDIHLIWTDVSNKNVGRLLKDNKVSWREDLPLTDEVLGLDKYRGVEQLKKGDIVILDNDFIFDEDTLEDIEWSKTPLANAFEVRYEFEQEKKNSVK